MKNLKKIVSLMLLLVFTIGVYGCGTKSPSNTVKNYLEEIKKGESADFSTMLNTTFEKEEKKDNSTSLQDTESFKKMIGSMKTLKYKINSENIDGDSATVNVTVNGPDLAAVIGEYIQKAFANAFSQAFAANKMTEEETNKLYDTMLSECLDNIKSTERTGDISLTKENGEWKINKDDSLSKLLVNIDDSTFGSLNSKEKSTKEQPLTIEQLPVDIKINEPDSIGNVYMDVSYTNNSNKKISSYDITVLLKDSNEKTYLVSNDTVLPGETSPKFSSSGPKTLKKDDIEFLKASINIINDDGTTTNLNYDYKLNKYQW